MITCTALVDFCCVFICTHSFACTQTHTHTYSSCRFIFFQIHLAHGGQKCDASVEKLISSYRLNVFDEFPHFLPFRFQLSAVAFFAPFSHSTTSSHHLIAMLCHYMLNKSSSRNNISSFFRVRGGQSKTEHLVSLFSRQFAMQLVYVGTDCMT